MDQDQKFQLEYYQKIIDRLEGNCFTIKALTITLSAASIAFTSQSQADVPLVLIASAALIAIFWRLDALFLAEGRRFRNIQSNFIAESDFDFNLPIINVRETNAWKVMFSWSVFWFYFSLFLLLSAIFWLTKFKTLEC